VVLLLTKISEMKLEIVELNCVQKQTKEQIKQLRAEKEEDRFAKNRMVKNLKCKYEETITKGGNNYRLEVGD